MWRPRRLSLSGKVLVLKADILPTLIYLAYMFPVPTRGKLKITREVFSFLWGGKYEYVKRELMYMRVDAGGRGVPCIPLKWDVLFVSHV